MGDLIFDENPLVIQRPLVRAIGGVLEAVLCQQLAYWLPRARFEHDGHPWVYKTYQEWGDEIGVSAKVARGALDKLRRDGWITSIQNPMDPRDRTLWWWIDVPAVRARAKAMLAGSPNAQLGSSEAAAGASAAAPGRPSAVPGSSNAGATEPEAETTAETTNREAAASGAPDSLLPDVEPKRKPITYRGKTVPRPVGEDALHLLGVFNDATGSNVGAFGRTGKQSDAVTRIVGALMDRPNVDRDTWERGIRGMAASPPSWLDERWAVGHMFGPRAADHTLSRAAASHSGAQRVASPADTDAQGWSRNDF